MRMQRFRVPSAAFIKEMIDTNISHDRTPLDLSRVPRSVLAKVVAAVVLRNLNNETAPKVEITLGPDAEFHHEIKGISVLNPTQANVFYEHEGSWYSVLFVLAPGENELFVLKLVDDAKDDWEVLDPNEAPDLEIQHQMCADTLAYLGILTVV